MSPIPIRQRPISTSNFKNFKKGEAEVKKFYEEPIMEVEKFMISDIITTSKDDEYEPGENETPGV